MTPLEIEVLTRARDEWVSLAEAASIARDQENEDPLEAAVRCALSLAEQSLARVGRYADGSGFTAWPETGEGLWRRLQRELAEVSASDPLEAQSNIMIDAI